MHPIFQHRAPVQQVSLQGPTHRARRPDLPRAAAPAQGHSPLQAPQSGLSRVGPLQGGAGSGRAGSARGLAGWCLLQALHWVPTEGPHFLPHLLPVVARSVKSGFWLEAPAASTQPFISLCTCRPELRARVSSPGSQGVLSAEYRLLRRLPERGRD